MQWMTDLISASVLSINMSTEYSTLYSNQLFKNGILIDIFGYKTLGLNRTSHYQVLDTTFMYRCSLASRLLWRVPQVKDEPSAGSLPFQQFWFNGQTCLLAWELCRKQEHNVLSVFWFNTVIIYFHCSTGLTSNNAVIICISSNRNTPHTIFGF